MSQDISNPAVSLESGVSVGRAGRGPGSRWTSFLDDHMNPIVVKELRQAVRSRFIQVVIHLMLVSQLAIVIMFLLGNMLEADYWMGQKVFLALHMLLLLGASVFVPLYVGVRFAAERTTQDVDLMYSTTLTPFSIIWGKFLSGMVVTVLLFSAVAPFTVLTYLLRGIDVPTILITLAIDLLVVLAAIQSLILLMAGATTLIARAGALLVWLIVLFMMLGTVIALTSESMFSGGGMSFTLDGFVFPAMGILLLMIDMHICAMLASTALISPPSSNRAFGLRVALIISWIVGGLIAYGVLVIEGYDDLIESWGWISVMVALFMFYISICERDRLSPRVLAQVPRNFLLRIMAFFFFSGSAGGALLWLFVITISFILMLPSSITLGNDFLEVLVFLLYTLAYGLTAVLFVRKVGGGHIRHQSTAAIALFMMTLGSMLPLLIAWGLDPFGNWDEGVWWCIANPWAGTAGYSHQIDVFVITSSIWLIAVFALCLPWIFGQFRAFRHMELTPKPSEDEAGLTPAAETPAQTVDPDAAPAKIDF